LNAATPTIPVVSAPVKTVPDMASPIAPFATLPDNARKFSSEYRGLIVLAVILFFTQFPIKFLASFVTEFNTVPVLPEAFKLVGMAVFVRTILFKAPRERFFALIRGWLAVIFKDRSADLEPASSSPAVATAIADPQSTSFQKFCTAVDEDFNFAGGLAVLFELAKSLGKQANILNHGTEIKAESLTIESTLLFQQWQELTALANVLGLEAKPDSTESIHQSSDAEIAALVAQRNQARQDKNFAEADRLRQELEDKGIELIDQKGTTTWRYR
jgi:hypothetical protein